MLEIDREGWLRSGDGYVERCPSPNFGERPAGEPISLLVIHNISLPRGQFGGQQIRQLFTNCLDCDSHPELAELAGLQVSAHLLIDREGELCQFVSFLKRAWHAGVSRFAGRENCNDFSIGIELEGTDDTPYTEAQYRALVRVTKTLQSDYPLVTSDRIVGHCDISPGRKTDPGGAFDWRHYKNQLD